MQSHVMSPTIRHISRRIIVRVVPLPWSAAIAEHLHLREMEVGRCCNKEIFPCALTDCLIDTAVFKIFHQTAVHWQAHEVRAFV